MLHLKCLALVLAGCLTAALLAQAVQAEAGKCSVSSEQSGTDSAQQLPLCSDLYPEHLYTDSDSPWKIGLGVGYGQRSNPLINSDDVPIYGILQLSYFGEHWFFDNGDVGWFLSEGNNWSVNAIAGVGGERSFYSFLNDGSVGFNPGLGASTGENLLQPPAGITVDSNDPNSASVARPEAPERDITVDGGLEMLYNLGPSEFQLQVVTDISGEHDGQELWFSWARIHKMGQLELVPSAGFNWKSSQAANYYYGVREDEATIALPEYRVGSAINVFARIGARYALNNHWNIIGVLQYEKLDHAISDSPAVKDDHVQTAFVGLYYEF
ncbi:MAG: MipA/OmpV family protein [Halioglobus sp.]